MTDPGKPPLLTSWKEIAAFFGRDVRTVQRWEREGLPVHRRPGARRSGVFAYPEEMERWLAGRPEASADSADHTPAAAVIHRRPVLRLVAVASALIAAIAGVAWTALWGSQAPEPAARTLASSSERLQLPRWANLDGRDGLDLVVTVANSPALIFRNARDRECRDDALACADTRIYAPDECWLQISHTADVNGDGLEDLLIGCLLRDPESFTATGPTYIVWGRRE